MTTLCCICDTELSCQFFPMILADGLPALEFVEGARAFPVLFREGE